MEFKPFDKVLVRDNEEQKWKVNFYSHYDFEKGCHVCVSSFWEYCIPYKGNEYLVGTDKSSDSEVEDFEFLQKIVAWNGEREQVKGYFFEVSRNGKGEKVYKIINAKKKCIDYFCYCKAEEWEEE